MALSRRRRPDEGTQTVVRTIFFGAQLLSLALIFEGTQETLNPIALELDRAPETTTMTTTTTSTSSSITTTTKSTHSASTKPSLPSLEELTSYIPANYACPNGMEIFPNFVLPTVTNETTHSGGDDDGNRKIPKVVHITAKTRCVTPQIKRHLLQWKLPGHSLYFHDDAAVYKLLDYALNDQHGHALIRNLYDNIICVSSGACLSDFWRYVLLYHYGGIYTDLDNSPGTNYTTDFITPTTDSFFFVEQLGTMTQFYMASSKHHPILLHFLDAACFKELSLYSTGNVMRNNPAKRTGPGAVKFGMIFFLDTINMTSDGYVPEGTYHGGGVGSRLQSQLPWYGLENSESGEYPTAAELENRSVTVHGKKEDSQLYINRVGLRPRHKNEAWKQMNMTHYFARTLRQPNQISCMQHVDRMRREVLNKTSIYYQTTKLVDLLPRYEYRENKSHFFDVNTNEMLIPWTDEQKRKAMKEIE